MDPLLPLPWSPARTAATIEIAVILDAINQALDAVMKEYMTDRRVVYKCEAERFKQHFRGFDEARQNWKRPSVCMYPGCDRTSVRRSHTIPRASLQLIADVGHVLTPEFSAVRGKLELVSKGVNDASTFAGFCPAHEQEFQSFERHARLGTEHDVAMQLFRTVCREIAITRHGLECLKKSLNRFVSRRTEWASNRFSQLLSRYGAICPKLNPRACTIEADDIVTRMEREVARIEGDLRGFQAAFYDTFLPDRPGAEWCIVVFSCSLSERVPVALAGRGNFVTRRDGDAMDSQTETVALLTVLPSPNGTDICIAVPEGHNDALAYYIHQFLGDDMDRDGVLSMIESWMMHGSDHWFMSPELWAMLEGGTRQAVLAAVMDTGWSILAQAAVPLLDSSRQSGNSHVKVRLGSMPTGLASV